MSRFPKTMPLPNRLKGAGGLGIVLTMVENR